MSKTASLKTTKHCCGEIKEQTSCSVHELEDPLTEMAAHPCQPLFHGSIPNHIRPVQKLKHQLSGSVCALQCAHRDELACSLTATISENGMCRAACI